MSYFLTTDRLGFRHWMLDDLPLAIALWTDAGVMGHMGGPMSSEDAAHRMAREMATRAAFGVQYWPMFSLATGNTPVALVCDPFTIMRMCLSWESTSRVPSGVHDWVKRPRERSSPTPGSTQTRTRSLQDMGPENSNSQALIERLGFVYTHHEPWGPHAHMHPYYRLNRPPR